MIYFAFGSNMDREQMKRRCPSHKVLGRAYLSDFDLCFPRRSPSRGCGTAGIRPAKGAGVWGVVYALEASDWASLNDAEGYWPGGSPENNRHIIEQIEVRQGGPDGAVISARTYRAQPDGTGALPSPAYMRRLIDGAIQHDLPQAYVATLRAVRTERHG
jgi:hypothetical protein